MFDEASHQNFNPVERMNRYGYNIINFFVKVHREISSRWWNLDSDIGAVDILEFPRWPSPRRRHDSKQHDRWYQPGHCVVEERIRSLWRIVPTQWLPEPKTVRTPKQTHRTHSTQRTFRAINLMLSL